MLENVMNKENIFVIERRIILDGKSFHDVVSTHPSVILVYKKSVELSELEKLENPVIIDFGGGGGTLGEVIKEYLKGKEFVYINMDYDSRELSKSGGNKLLASMPKPPVRANSADAVFILNPYTPVSEIAMAVANYKPKNSHEEVDKKTIINCLADIQSYEVNAPIYEALMALKVGGRMILAHQLDDRLKTALEIGFDLGVKSEFSNLIKIEKRHILELGEEVPALFKSYGDAEGSRNFLIQVFVKNGNEGIGERLMELENTKRSAEMRIDISLKSGVLSELRKEGKI